MSASVPDEAQAVAAGEKVFYRYALKSRLQPPESIVDLAKVIVKRFVNGLIPAALLELIKKFPVDNPGPKKRHQMSIHQNRADCAGCSSVRDQLESVHEPEKMSGPITEGVRLFFVEFENVGLHSIGVVVPKFLKPLIQDPQMFERGLALGIPH